MQEQTQKVRQREKRKVEAILIIKIILLSRTSTCFSMNRLPFRRLVLSPADRLRLDFYTVILAYTGSENNKCKVEVLKTFY